MNDMDELKKIFSSNLRRYLELNCKSQTNLARDLDIPTTTVSNWIQGNTYPRMDKIKILANYFKIAKSDLIEPPERPYDF